MRTSKKLLRSVLSGTMAMAIVSSYVITPAIASGAATEETDIAVAPDLTGTVTDGYENEGGIVFDVEETTAAETEDVVLSAPETDIPVTATAAAVVTPTPETTAVVKPVMPSMAEENGYKYYVTGGNAVIDSYIGEESEIEIPESLGGLAVTEIGYAAFSGNKKITSVKIPESVKRINHDAFNGCTSLVSISLSDGITGIQDGAFAGCESLKEMRLPESVSRIEDNTFSGCKSLTDITLNSNIDYIGKSAFAYCSSLSSFSIPESVTAIGDMAFSGSGLVSLDIPDTVLSLGYSVFADCKSLKEISLPDEITNLKSGNNKGMFSGCSSLTKVTFPKKLNEIGDIAFADCSSLESISIPDTVNTVGIELFRNCEKLKNVQIPESVTRIENGMFSGCISLPSVELHDGIEYIGKSAFENCAALDNVIIPEKTFVIGDSCFLNCAGLKEIDIPASVITLGTAALAGCTSLEKAALPDGIEVLGTTGDAGLFTNDISLKEVKLPSSLKIIGDHTFRNCMSMEKISIPASVSTIGSHSFENCTSLKEITIPENVLILNEKTFSGCRALSSVILPKNFGEAKNYAFENCTNLTDLGQKSGFFKFAEDTFTGCSSLSDQRATVFTNDTPVVNVSSAASVVGGLANFSVKYDLNDWISSDLAASGAVSFEVPMPEGLSLIESSVISDSADNKVSYEGNNGLISLSKPEGTLRFTARIEAYNENDYVISPKIHFASHDYNWTQRLPVMALTVPKITISSKSTVSSLECDVFGIAEPGRKVKIYVDGSLAASVTSNQYTGRYVATVSLPEKKDSEQYNISAVCGVDKTDEISVVYSNAKPSIRKVELMYCTHAPSDLTDYMETLDITGVFTKGEHPVIQYYPKGNMRFRMECDNADRINNILVKSQKGSEVKYLCAEYDAKEGAFITSKDDYFDESNHNYVPGSLNFVIIEKTINVIDEDLVSRAVKALGLDDIERDCVIIDDSSCICSIKGDDGSNLTDCYYNVADTVDMNGMDVSAKTIASSPEAYGFDRTNKKIINDGITYSMYIKTTYNSDISGGSASAVYDKAVLNKVDAAFSEARSNQYGIDDYFVVSQVMVPENKNAEPVLFISADAEKSGGNSTLRKAPDYSAFKVNNGGSGSSDDDDDNDSGFDFSNPYDLKHPDETASYAGSKVGDFFISVGELDADLGGNALPNASNARTMYDKLGYVNDAAGFLTDVNDANDKYDEETRDYQGNSSEDQYRRQVAETRRQENTFISFASKAVSGLPIIGDAMSYELGAAGEMIDRFLDLAAHQYDQIWEIEREMGWDKEGENRPSDDEFNEEYEEDGQLRTVLDPSGIVYEGIKSKTVSGAVVTCYMYNEDTGEWEIWNAEDYDQINPLITDAAGSYAWDVPEGRYYVTCEKDGYDLIKSEEFNVAPPKFDLDFNLLNEAAPAVNGYTLGENTITLEFTKVMDIYTVNSDSVSVSGIDGGITIEPQLHDAGDKFTDKFIISGDFSKVTELKIAVNSKASDYTGAAVTEYSADIENIYADLILEKESVDLVAEDTYQIKANKKITSFTSDDPEIASVDENGLVTAVSTGTAKIIAVDSTGKEATLTVAVEVKLVVEDSTAEKLEKQSLKDYKNKTGVTAAEAECKISDNKCVVEIKDKDGNILDEYTLDPETGKGTDSNGKAVDLPQTGNNSANAILCVLAAISMICSGWVIMRKSRVDSRKRD